MRFFVAPHNAQKTMRGTRTLLAGLSLLAFGSQIACGEGGSRGPSTIEERARAIALSRSVEREPISGDAAEARRWMRQWMAEVPDLKFFVCDDLLGRDLDGYPYAREIKDQIALSGAAFALEHQGKARDDVAVYVAGVEGALRTYEALLKSRPDARHALLDDFVAKRDRGELEQHVAELAKATCPKSPARTLWIAAVAGAGCAVLRAFVVDWLFRRSGAGRALSAHRPTIFRTFVFACAAYYVLVGAALHVLEPDYDPRFKFMSDYAWSAHGWLMTTTFFVLAAAIVIVALGLRVLQIALPSAGVGSSLLVVAAVSVCLAGVFRGFPLHDVAGAVAFPGMVMATLLLSWRFRLALPWQPIQRSAMLISVGMLAALLSMLAGIGWPGLQQRALLLIFLVWLCIVANQLVTIAAHRTPAATTVRETGRAR